MTITSVAPDEDLDEAGDESLAGEILAVEARARARGWSVADLCAKAAIHRATWQRWKAGASEPRYATWRAIRRLVDLD